MNALQTKILRLIENDGPISVALFMALCLGDPDHGYYLREEAFGLKGDFVTAPEISQLFGEIIGAFLAANADQLESGTPVTLVELGPGRGVLMADILRTLAQIRPNLFDRLKVALVETSPRLRQIQADRIARFKVPQFHASLETLPKDGPLLVVGNEFLDALPMRQYQKIGTQWRERLISVEENKLAFVLGASTLALEELPPAARQAPEGAIFEVAPARTAIAGDLARRLAQQTGTGLLIDYGHLQSGFGDTLQAMRHHRFVPVLEAPGEVDLTSHVDFEPL
ncbi:MAG: class I SAM-dependent methyltransferase, partial [Notoacmeibacter sp.]